jgi:hypothetical protein
MKKTLLRLVVLGVALAATGLSVPAMAGGGGGCPTATCSVLWAQCQAAGGSPSGLITGGFCLDDGVYESHGAVSCPGVFGSTPCTYR